MGNTVKAVCKNGHDRTLPDALMSDGTTCRECHSEKCRQRHKDNPGERRAYQLQRNYGITLDDYDEMLMAQNFACAICGTLEAGGPGRKFHVDHDHETGEVRGLLCHSCNTGIGSLGDDISRLEKAITYLKRG